jgi:hypothetical protein
MPAAKPATETEERDEKQIGPVSPRIRCPLCGWTPRAHDRWRCSCGHHWNTFDTGGVCPACLRQWTEACCLRCHKWSPHSDWYQYGDEPLLEAGLRKPSRNSCQHLGLLPGKQGLRQCRGECSFRLEKGRLRNTTEALSLALTAPCPPLPRRSLALLYTFECRVEGHRMTDVASLDYPVFKGPAAL